MNQDLKNFKRLTTFYAWKKLNSYKFCQSLYFFSLALFITPNDEKLKEGLREAIIAQLSWEKSKNY